MKRIFIILISSIIICLTGLGVIGYFVEKNDKNLDNNQVVNEEQINGETTQWAVLDENTLDINKIKGYTPGGKVVEGTVDNSTKGGNSSNTNSTNNNTNNGSTNNSNNNSNNVTNPGNSDTYKEEKTTVTEVGGLKLPYTPQYKNMEIISIGSYNGKFMEDGSDAKKSNVLAMVVKNTSDKVIDYGHIILKISGQNEGLTFKISNLKPGASALVLESSGKVGFNENDRYIYLDSRNEMIDEMPPITDDIKITTENKKITVENISDKNLNTVYVYYKTISPGGCYLGGITYRTKFVKLDAGKKVSADTLHFSKKNSEIIMVESVNE